MYSSFSPSSLDLSFGVFCPFTLSISDSCSLLSVYKLKEKSFRRKVRTTIAGKIRDLRQIDSSLVIQWVSLTVHQTKASGSQKQEQTDRKVRSAGGGVAKRAGSEALLVKINTYQKMSVSKIIIGYFFTQRPLPLPLSLTENIEQEFTFSWKSLMSRMSWKCNFHD